VEVEVEDSGRAEDEEAGNEEEEELDDG